MTQLWSSGGGTQSAAIAALIVSGRIPPPDLACIADTGREASETWAYMDKVITPALQSVGVTLHRVEKSKYATVDVFSTNGSLLIPAHTTQSGHKGKLPAFCSNEWKQRVVRRWARAQGIKSADVWIGFSTDEPQRVSAATNSGPWRNRFPLIEQRMNRADCIALVLSMGWPPPPRSSCWMCPNRSPQEWRLLKESGGDDWRRAVLFDRWMRTKDPHAWLTAECVPLDEAKLDEDQMDLLGCDSGQCFV